MKNNEKRLFSIYGKMIMLDNITENVPQFRFNCSGRSTKPARPFASQLLKPPSLFPSSPLIKYLNLNQKIFSFIRFARCDSGSGPNDPIADLSDASGLK